MPTPNTNEDRMPFKVYCTPAKYAINKHFGLYSDFNEDRSVAYIRKDFYDVMEKCLRECLESLQGFLGDGQIEQEIKNARQSIQSATAIKEQV